MRPIDDAAVRPGPDMNETLRRIYALLPSVKAWVITGVPSPLWATVQDAARGIQEYIGPAAKGGLGRSLHLSNEEQDFLESAAALEAIFAVIQEIYTGHSSLLEGLFPASPTLPAQP